MVFILTNRQNAWPLHHAPCILQILYDYKNNLPVDFSFLKRKDIVHVKSAFMHKYSKYKFRSKLLLNDVYFFV